MSSISIMMNIDTQTTVSRDSARVLMFSDNAGDTGQGGNELTTNAAIGDVIYWYAMSTDPNYRVILTDFSVTGGGAVIGQPDKTDVPQQTGGVYEVRIAAKGSMSYTFTFEVYSTDGGAKVGGPYSWDPFVHVNH